MTNFEVGTSMSHFIKHKALISESEEWSAIQIL